jgi:alkyl hydroperoxide reductase subunit AhpF
MAVASPRIKAECIEATQFPELSQRYRVMAVPKIVINDRVEFEGALPERDFLSAVLQAVSPDPPARDGEATDGEATDGQATDGRAD